jgi:hypothetical protein
MANAGRIELVGEAKIDVKKEGQGSGSFFIFLNRNAIRSVKTKLRVGIYDGNKKITVLKTSFMGPFNKF